MNIPVQRAETYYLPPPSLPATAWDLVPRAELVLRWYEQRQQRRVPVPSGTVLGVTLWARIDAGRWVADCLCRSAQVVTPADPRFACPECGGGWFTVQFPADVAAAEAAVDNLPPNQRFWWQPDDPNPWNRPAPATPPAAGGKELTS